MSFWKLVKFALSPYKPPNYSPPRVVRGHCEFFGECNFTEPHGGWTQRRVLANGVSVLLSGPSCPPLRRQFELFQWIEDHFSTLIEKAIASINPPPSDSN